jgi:hypothetical protein
LVRILRTEILIIAAATLGVFVGLTYLLGG